VVPVPVVVPVVVMEEGVFWRMPSSISPPPFNTTPCSVVLAIETVVDVVVVVVDDDVDAAGNGLFNTAVIVQSELIV
jgi:hypothetical protein